VARERTKSFNPNVHPRSPVTGGAVRDVFSGNELILRLTIVIDCELRKSFVGVSYGHFQREAEEATGLACCQIAIFCGPQRKIMRQSS
jgi:hypothetical protein